MTRSLRRHYKGCGKCHGNERLKRKAFRRLRKTDIEGADVTSWGRLFQVRAAATGKARSPMVDSHVLWTFSVSEEEEWRRLRVPESCFKVASLTYGYKNIEAMQDVIFHENSRNIKVLVLLRSSKSISRSRSSMAIKSDRVRDLSYSIFADFPV